jgi:hypothetical protein
MLKRILSSFLVLAIALFSSSSPAMAANTADITWRQYDNSQGRNTVWRMAGVGYSSIDLTAVSNQCWKQIGSGDLNLDNNPDIFWRFQCTGPSQGRNTVWYLNSQGQVIGTADLHINTNLQEVGADVKDANYDGVPDIIYHNKTSNFAIIDRLATNGGVAGRTLISFNPAGFLPSYPDFVTIDSGYTLRGMYRVSNNSANFKLYQLFFQRDSDGKHYFTNSISVPSPNLPANETLPYAYRVLDSRFLGTDIDFSIGQFTDDFYFPGPGNVPQQSMLLRNSVNGALKAIALDEGILQSNPNAPPSGMFTLPSVTNQAWQPKFLPKTK